MVTQKSIEANLLNIRATLDIEALTNVNEVQRLTGKIVALSHSISKAAEKALPFFKTLSKAKNFEWDTVVNRPLKNSMSIWQGPPIGKTFAKGYPLPLSFFLSLNS
ncbi:UNVERIFIED_CONTAM: hypothetical protein Sangu_2498600 [Sesamum angustifolium]|uniref:Uncharacterized protein n=1 Tax=Sesamum angustifolium TaxID=2727405 RepID=A0AAW2KCW6_9LAMI